MAARNEMDKAKRSRKTVLFAIGAYPEADAEYERYARLGSSFYSYMLVEDICNGFMPIGGTRASGEFKISLKEEDREFETILARATSIDYPRGELAEAISDLFRECVKDVVLFGEAYYEIVRIQDSDNNPQFQLVRIRPRTIRRKRGTFYQEIPDELAVRLDKPKKIQLSNHDLLRFYAPKCYRKDLKRVLKALTKIGDLRFQELESSRNASPEETEGFDGRLNRHTEELALAEATKLIGWDVRGLIYHDVFDYYVLHRYMRFQLFLAKLREHFLKLLNAGLDPIRQQTEHSGVLIIEGLASSFDIEKAIKELAEGSMSFERVMKEFGTI